MIEDGFNPPIPLALVRALPAIRRALTLDAAARQKDPAEVWEEVRPALIAIARQRSANFTNRQESR